MAITKAELLSDIDSSITTATGKLADILSTGSIDDYEDRNKAYEYIFTIDNKTNQKTWIEANL